MREILFRGKRLDNGEWVEGWYEMYPFGRWPVKTSIIPSEEAKDGRYEHVQVDPSTVGQYTGLKDKNGKRIFEGDIVRYPDSDTYNSYNDDINEGVVDWDEDVMCFYFTNRWVIGMADFDIENGRMTEVEVIGNIHDGPELLEGGGE